MNHGYFRTTSLGGALIVLIALLRRGALQAVGWMCLGLALLSTLWMAYWYTYRMEGADPSRVYFG